MTRSIGTAMLSHRFDRLRNPRGGSDGERRRRLTTLLSVWALLGVRGATDTAASQIADG